MTYLNNPRGRGQQAGYYLPIKRINQVRLMILFLISLAIISSLSANAYSVKMEVESSIEEEKMLDFPNNGLYQDLEEIRILVHKCDKLRAYNYRMTGGPVPTLSKAESDHIRENYRLIKKMEIQIEAKRKKLDKKYPELAKSSISTVDLIYLGEEDLALALSVPAPSNSQQLFVLLGIGLVSMGMIGICMKSLSEPNQTM